MRTDIRGFTPERRRWIYAGICCLLSGASAWTSAWLSGDTVTIMGGDALSADALASWLGTINYEIVCMFSPRVPRVYVENGQNI